VASIAVRETTELVTRTFARDAAEMGTEALASRLARAAATHGEEEVLAAVRKVGPRALEAIEKAGPGGGHEAACLIARYGERAIVLAEDPARLALARRFGSEAAEVIMKHPGAAEGVVEQLGSSGARALANVNGQNARRVAMLTEDGFFKQAPGNRDLLGVIEKYGDRAADFIWRNKGALAAAGVVTAFVAHPEPFLDGTAKLADATGRYVAAPFVSAATPILAVGALCVVMAALAPIGIGTAIRVLRHMFGITCPIPPLKAEPAAGRSRRQTP
jgi:hypothetical protein